jgi:uncharacterized protein (DUF1330 family)
MFSLFFALVDAKRKEGPPVAAYLIADFEITNPEGFQEYAQRVGTTIEHHGGTYLVRGERAEIIEGDWRPHRLVILKFESVEQARRWYSSDEYTAIKAIRHQTAKTRLVLVPGVSGMTGRGGEIAAKVRRGFSPPFPNLPFDQVGEANLLSGSIIGSKCDELTDFKVKSEQSVRRVNSTTIHH